jgi:anti-sigma factor ChrR (cupin superfamily)
LTEAILPHELINADFSQRVVIDTDRLPWTPSPQAGVERRMLDRIGGEIARATSLVRYAPASSFSPHDHAMGEEFLVLDGVFSDEHGDYPAGTYVRNPPGSRHSPRTAPGCTLLVKLRQMKSTERQRVVIDTTSSIGGHRQAHLVLFAANGEHVSIERLEAGASADGTECPDGEEIFILAGDLADRHGTYGPRTWIRNPPAFQRRLKSIGGATYWLKQGHLRETTL